MFGASDQLEVGAKPSRLLNRVRQDAKTIAEIDETKEMPKSEVFEINQSHLPKGIVHTRRAKR